MRYQDDINTEHNMKSRGRAAVAQWTKRLTRNGQTRVRIREAHNFDITLSFIFSSIDKKQSLALKYISHYTSAQQHKCYNFMPSRFCIKFCFY